MLVPGLGNLCKTFYELPVVANKAKEGSNLGVSLQQCILSNGL